MKIHAKPLLVLVLSTAILPTMAADKQQYISVLPRQLNTKSANAKAQAIPQTNGSSKTQTSRSAKPADTATNNAKLGTSEAETSEQTSEQAENTAPVRSFYSAELEQAVKQYRAENSSQAHVQMLNALRTCLLSQGQFRVSPSILVKDNPYLADFRPKVLESNGLRIWSFPKCSEKNRVLMQWYETREQVIGTGRRKRVLTTNTVRFQEISFAQNLSIKDAGILNLKDTGKFLLLAGDAEDGSLALKSFKASETGWQETSEFLDRIPDFLRKNVCGRVSFRGADLLLTLGKMLEFTDSSGAKKYMPEAESACYKFWLKFTDTGYVMAPTLANEEAFSAVFQFMQAVSQGRTDVEKNLLSDPRLISLPKYLGLQGKPLDAAARVVEMPMVKGNRFRIINIGKNDLIFDVIRAKNQWQIKALFVASPDPFLIQTAKYFPTFSRFEQKQEQDKEKLEATAAGGLGSNVKRK